MQTFQSISKCGEAFSTEQQEYYMGGLLKHARALSALVAPATNSYTGENPPLFLRHSTSNRSAACAIRAGRVEFRPPDPSANPYLAFAAMLMAGLDGIVNQIHPGPAMGGDLTPEELRKIPVMPGSLEEALDCLEEDHEFLTKSDVFSEDLLDGFVEYKRMQESDAVRMRPHPYEFALYYDA